MATAGDHQRRTAGRIERFKLLHARLLAPAPGATAAIRDEIARLILSDLRTAIWWPAGTNPADTDAYIDDALMVYFGRPELYDPVAGNPLAWFAKVARRLAAYNLRQERRRQRREDRRGVDLEEIAPRAEADDSARRRRIRAARMGLEAVRAAKPEERAFVEAKLDKAPIDAQAAALGISHLPLASQKAEIKRVWGLIVKRLKYRFGG